MDCHLAPFYEADIAAGRITRDGAYEIILELWKKLNIWGCGDTLMQLMVGGQNADGSDASSELSVMMLTASRETARLGMTEPHINVRHHSGIRADLMEEAYRLQFLGGGQVSVYNDDIIIPEMLACGIPPEIACQYANDGCTEIIWDGCGKIDFNHIDAVATLELALRNGKLSPFEREKIRYFHADNTPEVYEPDVVLGYMSGAAEECSSYDDFYELFMRQYMFQIDSHLDELYREDRALRSGAVQALPLLCGTFDEILDSGIGILEGGLPMNTGVIFLGSVPTVADSLAALKCVVYRDHLATIAQIKDAMLADWVGHEPFRLMLAGAPKFGNDDDEVDLIAKDIVERCLAHIAKFRDHTGMNVFGALLGWRSVQEAYGVGATPDRRHRKAPIAEHYCATPGRAVSGITALINSVAKAPLAKALGTAATQLSLPRSLLRDERTDMELLRTINRVCLKKGLMGYNIAVYDTDTLRRAQANPESYADIIVRVWGFSARFVNLSREMQDHVISRTLEVPK